MTDILQRAAKAIDDELERQSKVEGFHFHPRSAGDDWNAIDGNILVTPLARAVLRAIREPSEAMVDAAYAEGTKLNAQWDAGTDPETAWQAMIDAALNERG